MPVVAFAQLLARSASKCKESHSLENLAAAVNEDCTADSTVCQRRRLMFGYALNVFV